MGMARINLALHVVSALHVVPALHDIVISC